MPEPDKYINGVSETEPPPRSWVDIKGALVANTKAVDRNTARLDKIIELLQAALLRPAQPPLPFPEEPSAPALVTETAATPPDIVIPPPRPKPGVNLDQTIDDEWAKGLKPRWREPLRRAGILTMRQVVTMKDSELLRIERVGKDGLELLKELLAPLGLETASDRLLEFRKHNEGPAVPPLR